MNWAWNSWPNGVGRNREMRNENAAWKRIWQWPNMPHGGIEVCTSVNFSNFLGGRWMDCWDNILDDGRDLPILGDVKLINSWVYIYIYGVRSILVNWILYACYCIIIWSLLCFPCNLQDWDSQNASQIATELCGFVTILSGTFLLHKTKDMGNSKTLESPVFASPSIRSSNSISG